MKENKTNIENTRKNAFLLSGLLSAVSDVMSRSPAYLKSMGYKQWRNPFTETQMHAAAKAFAEGTTNVETKHMMHMLRNFTNTNNNVHALYTFVKGLCTLGNTTSDDIVNFIDEFDCDKPIPQMSDVTRDVRNAGLVRHMNDFVMFDEYVQNHVDMSLIGEDPLSKRSAESLYETLWYYDDDDTFSGFRFDTQNNADFVPIGPVSGYGEELQRPRPASFVALFKATSLQSIPPVSTDVLRIFDDAIEAKFTDHEVTYVNRTDSDHFYNLNGERIEVIGHIRDRTGYDTTRTSVFGYSEDGILHTMFVPEDRRTYNVKEPKFSPAKNGYVYRSVGSRSYDQDQSFAEGSYSPSNRESLTIGELLSCLPQEMRDTLYQYTCIMPSMKWVEKRSGKKVYTTFSLSYREFIRKTERDMIQPTQMPSDLRSLQKLQDIQFDALSQRGKKILSFTSHDRSSFGSDYSIVDDWGDETLNVHATRPRANAARVFGDYYNDPTIPLGQVIDTLAGHQNSFEHLDVDVRLAFATNLFDEIRPVEVSSPASNNIGDHKHASETVSLRWLKHVPVMWADDTKTHVTSGSLERMIATIKQLTIDDADRSGRVTVIVPLRV